MNIDCVINQELIKKCFGQIYRRRWMDGWMDGQMDEEME